VTGLPTTRLSENPTTRGSAPHRRPTRQQRRKTWLDDWWFAACGIALILGSDYKTRVRPPGQAISGGIDSSVLIELALYGLVGIYVLLRHFRLPLRIQLTPHLYFMCCFVGLVMISALYSPYPQYAIVRSCQLLIVLLLLFAAILDATRAHLHRFAHAYLLLITFSVFYGVILPSPPVNAVQEGRFTWLAIHPTVAGVMTGLAVVVAAAYLCGHRDRPGPVWSKKIYALMFVVVFGGMLAVQTRGAVGAALGGILVLLIAMLPRRAVVDFLIGLLVVGAGLAIAGSQVITLYFERGGDGSDITTLNSRTELWTVATEAIARQPLFGHGVTSTRGIFYDALGLGGGHNAAINVIVDVGLVGFAVWTAAVICLLVGVRRLSRSRVRDQRLDRAIMLGVITFLMIDGIFFEGPGSVANVASTWFFVCLAWLSVLQRDAMQRDRAQTTSVGAAVESRVSTSTS
jgi:exopolysaccharide production protein ExoQ